jgi:hypothetical protein
MTKRADTIALEDWLFYRVQNRRSTTVVSEFGATEVTLTNKPVKSVSVAQTKKTGYLGRVDFISVSTDKIVRAYEIKVSMSDFRSKAIKSWVGHFNYLVTTDELAQKHKKEILAELPQDIGWLTPAGFIKKPLKRDPLIDLDWLIWLMMKSNAVAVAKHRSEVIRNIHENPELVEEK